MFRKTNVKINVNTNKYKLWINYLTLSNTASYGKGSTPVLKDTDESSNQFSDLKILLRAIVTSREKKEQSLNNCN